MTLNIEHVTTNSLNERKDVLLIWNVRQLKLIT